MYKILASALAILLSTQMVVPLAFAVDQPEAKTGTTLQNAGLSELSGETTSRTASLTTLGGDTDVASGIGGIGKCNLVNGRTSRVIRGIGRRDVGLGSVVSGTSDVRRRSVGDTGKWNLVDNRINGITSKL